jgi:hypothetical protein
MNWLACVDTLAPSELVMRLSTARAASSQLRASTMAWSVDTAHG